MNNLHIARLNFLYSVSSKRLNDNERIELLELLNREDIEKNVAERGKLYSLIYEIKDEKLKMEKLIEYKRYLQLIQFDLIFNSLSLEAYALIIKKYFQDNLNEFNLSRDNIKQLISRLPDEIILNLLKNGVFNSDLEVHYKTLEEIEPYIDSETIYGLINDIIEKINEQDPEHNTPILFKYVKLIKDDDVLLRVLKDGTLNSDIRTHYEVLKKVAPNLDSKTIYELIYEVRENIIKYDNFHNTSALASYIMLIKDNDILVRVLCENKEYIGNVFDKMINKSFDMYNSKSRKENLNRFMETFSALYDEGEINYEIFLDEEFQDSEALELQGILLYSKKLLEDQRKLVIENLYKLKSELKKNERQIIIESFINGTIDPVTFTNIKTSLDYNVWENYFQKSNMVYSQSFTNRISMDVLNNINNSHINKIISLIMTNYGDKVSVDMIEIAFTMYLTLGFDRAVDILNSKYGTISYDYLKNLFTKYDLRFVAFEKDGKKMKPILNQKFINILMGSNYKVKNTPLKKLLNGKLQNTSDEMIYLRNISRVHSHWQIIEEEYARKEANSNLHVKIDIKTIVEIINNFVKIENRNLDPKLAQTDFFKYAGRNLQFTKGKTKKDIIERGLSLSKGMEKVQSKKFPFININRDGYSLEVLSPKDRSILCMGYETGCCFRPCGNADDKGKDSSLLSYCTKTEYGGAIVLKDENGKTVFFSPLLRNGNVLIIHSIESSDPDIRKNIGSKKSKLLHEMLSEYARRTIEYSEAVEDTPIEVVVLGNLHYVDKSLSKGQIEVVIPPYTEDDSFDEMYNNLNCGFSILSSSESYTGLKLGSVSYSYRTEKSIAKEIYINEEKIEEVEYCMRLKSYITDLINSLPSIKYEERSSVTAEINKLKKEYTDLFKNNVTNIEKKEKLDYIINTINENGRNEKFKQIENINYLKYSDGFYIAMNVAGEIQYNFTDFGKEECLQEITNLKNNMENIHL